MRILREPLLHFLVLGVLVYVAAAQLEDEPARYRIDAGPQRRARLELAYEQQYGVAPSAPQLQQLVEQYVRSEILYREGLALGLERDDEIVRRRVVQKVEFVNEDLDPQAPPDETGLTRYFEAHRDRYITAPTVTFEQIFVSVDSGGDTVALARSQDILRSIQAVSGARRTAALGDPFAAGADFTALSRIGANGLFGDSQLSEALFTQPVGEWGGPYRSAYGWHLVRISEHHGAGPATLTAVRARVIADYSADLREQRNVLAYRRIASKYRIVTDEPRA